MTSGPGAAPPARPVIALPPREGAPTSLVVLLHGVGASAASFERVARALAPALPGAELLVPDGHAPFDGGDGGRQWFSITGITDADRPARVRAAATAVSAWIDAELARRGLPGDRLAVVGFSQGAIVGAWLAVHRSPAPAAVAMLSGRVAVDAPPPPGARRGRVLLAHGDQDARVPVDLVEPGARQLAAWGVDVTTRIYPGLGHGVAPDELADVAAFVRGALAAA